jgi:peptide alpha-N-acetyltransferase
MAELEAAVAAGDVELEYVQYEAAQEEQRLPAIRQLISKDLSEPYSIYVYRYFLYQWGDLCYMVRPLPVPSAYPALASLY